MGLWDVVSGKAVRNNIAHNRVIGAATDYAWERQRKLKLKGALEAWGKTMIFAVTDATQALTIDAEDPEWRAAAKDPQAVHRLACFLANLFAARAIERNPQWFQFEDGSEDAGSAQMRADFTWLRRELFPDDDPLVAAAIKREADADALVVENSAHAVREKLAAFQQLIGATPATIMDRKSSHDAFAYTGTIVAWIDATTNYFEEFAQG
jgi:hypothetical protein